MSNIGELEKLVAQSKKNVAVLSAKYDALKKSVSP